MSELRRPSVAWRAAPLVLSLCLAAAGPVLAQVSLDEPALDEHDAKRVDRIEKVVRELRAIVFQGRETGQPVVVQPADTQGQVQRLTDRLADIDQTLAKLNGQLEVMRHDLDQSQHQAGDLRAANAQLETEVADLQKQIVVLKGPPPAPVPIAPAATAGAPAGAPDSLSAAQAAMAQGDMASAEAGFRNVLSLDPDGPLAPEARYGLAHTLIARQSWPEAAEADIGAIRGWPQTRWAPLAVIDLSRALIEMGKAPDACSALAQIPRRYPKASAASFAEVRRLRVRAKCE
ncbi:MAG TPA: tetratricopeptide repeat protein [Caulobacteraceae bacterium]|jgi:TolA-binding protein|nr:tetratricopeptide repeat protein [Caulobacteraceae bacterium]